MTIIKEVITEAGSMTGFTNNLSNSCSVDDCPLLKALETFQEGNLDFPGTKKYLKESGFQSDGPADPFSEEFQGLLVVCPKAKSLSRGSKCGEVLLLSRKHIDQGGIKMHEGV